MEKIREIYMIIAILTAGVGLSTGFVHILIGFSKEGNRLNKIIGFMGLCMFLFSLWPPAGYIIVDHAPYPTDIVVKRIYIWIYYLLLPWFIAYYSGFIKKWIILAINIITFSGYIIMAMESTEKNFPNWLMISMSSFGLILLYGVFSVNHLRKENKDNTWLWFFAAMVVYGLLYGTALYDHFANNFFGRMIGTKYFFPFHLNHLAFVLIMSIRIQRDSISKNRLEKVLQVRNTRWDHLMNRINLIIVALDTEGRITYANPYAVKKLGYTDVKELISLDWFQTFLKSDNIKFERTGYKMEIEGGALSNDFRGHLLAKDGELLVVHWSRVLEYNDDGLVRGTLNIGMDLTEKENYLTELQLLKSELEKESVRGVTYTRSGSEDGEIIGSSQALNYALQKARQVAETNVSVLLEGETGVGKELFADLIHRHSNRKTKPLIKINCAALPPELIESELFGHEKGAFTHAFVSRKGRFELANGGTLFLDEIGEMPPSLQSKLLRVLQTGEFERIGGQQTIQVDVRIISATNRDLLGSLRDGSFREDLYYRLNVFPITIPALRNRKEDIPLLVNHFIKILSDELNKSISHISKADMNRLCEYPWPGNVRELINILERSMISSQGNTLKVDWGHLQHPAFAEKVPNAIIRDVERVHIMKVLKECNWKINGPDGAAEVLGLNPNTLRSRMKKLNITRNPGNQL